MSTIQMENSLPSTPSQSYSNDVALKVLRRAQVSKMTWALRNRLALANVKIQNGWEKMSLDAIEPKVELQLQQRKRPRLVFEPYSDRSSSDIYFPSSVPSTAISGLDFSIVPNQSFPYCDSITAATSTYRRPSLSSYRQPFIPTDHFHRCSGFSFCDNSHLYSLERNFQRKNSFKKPNGLKQPCCSSLVARQPDPSCWRLSHSLQHSSPDCGNFDQSSLNDQTLFSDESSVSLGDDLLFGSSSRSEGDDEDIAIPDFSSRSESARAIRSSPPVGLTSPASKPATPKCSTSKLIGLTSCIEPHTPSRHGVSESGTGISAITSTSTGTSAAAAAAARLTSLPSSVMYTPNSNSNSFFGLSCNTPCPRFNLADFLNVSPSSGGAVWSGQSGTTAGAVSRSLDAFGTNELANAGSLAGLNVS